MAGASGVYEDYTVVYYEGKVHKWGPWSASGAPTLKSEPTSEGVLALPEDSSSDAVIQAVNAAKGFPALTGTTVANCVGDVLRAGCSSTLADLRAGTRGCESAEPCTLHAFLGYLCPAGAGIDQCLRLAATTADDGIEWADNAQLHIRTPSGRSLGLPYEPTLCVLEVKRLVALAEGMPGKTRELHLRLVFAGKVLDAPYRRISSYGVHSGSAVVCMCHEGAPAAGAAE